VRRSLFAPGWTSNQPVPKEIGFVRIKSMVSAVAGTAALALVVSACGNESGGAAPGAVEPVSAEQALSKIADQLDGMDSWKFTLDMTGPVTMSGTGEYQVSPLAMEMNFDKFDVGGQTFGDGIKMRMVDDVVYLSLGQLTQSLGGEWVKFDTSESGQFGELSKTFSQQDPRVQMRLFASSTNGRVVGTETIDGVETTHYAATLDVNEVAEVAGLSASELAAAKEAFGRAGVDSLSYDVWVDGDFRPRQLKVNLPSSTGELDMTMHITDINTPVDISAPPASEVVEAPTS
jgi:outer membrane lipoprotein-sorting protein